MKYGFIGCGNMGGAIAKALSKSTTDIALSDRSGKGRALAEQLGISYSDNDTMCTRVHYDLLAEALGARENVTLRLLSGKGHNPNYTADAVAYLGEYVKAKGELLRKKDLTEEEKAAFRASFDWNRMTAQDPAVWEEIFACLDQ